MSKISRINTEFNREITDAANRFRDHEITSIENIKNWMFQFNNSDLKLAAKLLRTIRYYSAQNIRKMAVQLCRRIVESFPRPKNEIYFITSGAVGDSSEVIIRSLRTESSLNGCNFKSMTDLDKIDADNISLIIYVDDFSATGTQLKDWWETVEPIILPKQAKVIIALLALCYKAKIALEQLNIECKHMDYIDESYNVFDESNTTFSKEEKDIIRFYCRRTSCPDIFREGYGNLGLLLSFRHGCPNNSLPILWYKNKGWKNLFLRSGI